MGDIHEQVRLCPSCEYGHFFRTVKDENGIPYDIHYTCGPFEGPRGPGGWDGKTCPNFVEGKKKDPLEGCTVSYTESTHIGRFRWGESG
jgi:hypothetical protein